LFVSQSPFFTIQEQSTFFPDFFLILKGESKHPGGSVGDLLGSAVLLGCAVGSAVLLGCAVGSNGQL